MFIIYIAGSNQPLELRYHLMQAYDSQALKDSLTSLDGDWRLRFIIQKSFPR